MRPLGHVGHVTYSFINMLLISTGIVDDTLRPQIVSVGTIANTALTSEQWLSQCVILCLVITLCNITLT
jgi:hypothetical protein